MAVCGFGINDVDYQVTRWATSTSGNKICEWRCPYYSTWRRMIERCYSKAKSRKYDSYQNCVVCDEWRSFKAFRSWMERQEWKGNSLDKDILVKGNKTYSPEFCVFVPMALNNFITESNSARGKYPIGVSKNERTGKFLSRCKNGYGKIINIGHFDSAIDAHIAWKIKKRELVESLFSNQPPNVYKALCERYE